MFHNRTCKVGNMVSEKATVLIVDDNPDLLDLLQIRIAQRNHHVLSAENGRQALTILQEQSVHLILLDIMMPEMDGYEVLQHIKANANLSSIPVVVMSALNDMDSVIRCIELGAEDYLFKPINNALLWARVDASLAKKRLHDQEQAQLRWANVWKQLDRELNTTLDLTTVAQITLNWAMRQTGAAAGLIGATTESELDLWHSVGLPEAGPDTISCSALAAAKECVLNGRPLQLQLNTQKPLVAAANYRVFVPISRDEANFALMVLDSSEQLDDTHLNFLSRLSSHAAIALTNAHLHTKVQAANSAKSNFVALVSHELKAPLTILKLYVELLNRQNTAWLVQKKGDYLQTFESTIQRMTQLVTELDDVTRIETGNMQLALTAVSLHEIIAEVISTFDNLIKEKELHISLDQVPSLPPLLADRQRLTQILTNLVSNACKYTPAGGQITLRSRRKPDDPETFAQIAIQDSGIGIDQADQSKIFTQFFRAESVQSQKISGTGLGLNITRKLVELQGGQIWFESEADQGTAFYFTLPFAEQ